MNILPIAKIPEEFNLDNLLEAAKVVGQVFKDTEDDKTHLREYLFKSWLLLKQEEVGNSRLERDLIIYFTSFEIRKYITQSENITPDILIMKFLSMLPSIENRDPKIDKSGDIETFINQFDGNIGGNEINFINTLKLVKSYDISPSILIKTVIVLSYWWERIPKEKFIKFEDMIFADEILFAENKTFKEISEELLGTSIPYPIQNNW